MADADGSSPGLPPIVTRDQLVAALKDAAELEHLFICQYLYAAFSLKKGPDATCNPAQFEAVRRWASVVYMVARQEMEHLSLVLSMLTAIGERPHLDRPNLPTQFPQFLGAALRHRHGPGPEGHTPCDLPFLLEPFALREVRRFTCMEAPCYEQTHGAEHEAVGAWCFEDAQGRCGCIAPAGQAVAVHRLHSEAAEVDRGGLVTGDIERFYQRIRLGFQTLAAGPDPLFTGDPGRQVVILSEYDIFLFPVTDLASALAAIDLITEQGEGLKGPPGFDSHFRSYYEMALEFRAIEERAARDGIPFEPARPIPLNPTRGEIRDPLTLRVFDLFNEGYATLTFMLTGLYGHFSSPEQYPYLGAALQETVFAPAMTMLIRPLAEILVQLPLADGPERAAPAFFLDDSARALLADPGNPCFADVGFYLGRMERIERELGAILYDPASAGAEESIRTRLGYIRQNVWRLAGNLRQIYQGGVYAKFRTSP